MAITSWRSTWCAYESVENRRSVGPMCIERRVISRDLTQTSPSRDRVNCVDAWLGKTSEPFD